MKPSKTTTRKAGAAVGDPAHPAFDSIRLCVECPRTAVCDGAAGCPRHVAALS